MKKVLFIDPDETSFQLTKCVARVITQFPPLEFIHSTSFDEASSLIEETNPNLVVIDDQLEHGIEEFLNESEGKSQVFVILTSRPGALKHLESNRVICVPQDGSLEGVHKTLFILASLASKSGSSELEESIH